MIEAHRWVLSCRKDVSAQSFGLYSALDAYVRHIPGVIPTDAVANLDAKLGAAALTMMERNMSAGLTLAGDCLG